MKKVLPISLKNRLETECWSFFRFVIIEAYDNLKNWKFEKYNKIYADGNGNVFFGC